MPIVLQLASLLPASRAGKDRDAGEGEAPIKSELLGLLDSCVPVIIVMVEPQNIRREVASSGGLKEVTDLFLAGKPGRRNIETLFPGHKASRSVSGNNRHLGRLDRTARITMLRSSSLAMALFGLSRLTLADLLWCGSAQYDPTMVESPP